MAECGNEEKRGLRGAVRCAYNRSFLVASSRRREIPSDKVGVYGRCFAPRNDGLNVTWKAVEVTVWQVNILTGPRLP
jgi:hypothetical protein